MCEGSHHHHHHRRRRPRTLVASPLRDRRRDDGTRPAARARARALAQVLADQTVWSLYLNAMYSFLIGTLALRNPRDVWADVKSTSWPALRSSWRFWPFVHTISFSHAVPLDLKLLWVDMMEIVWVTILSKVANDDKESKLAENPEAETLDVVEAFGVDPTLEIELTREAELAPVCDGDACAPAPLAFELPQKVLGACWPLIAMWPVIYGTNLLEKSLGLEV